MSESQQRKAVYFSEDEFALKKWAEAQPEGFSSYIKHLIMEDQRADNNRNAIAQVLHEFIRGEEARQFLVRGLSEVLEGKLISPIKPDDINLDIEEANAILNLISGI